MPEFYHTSTGGQKRLATLEKRFSAIVDLSQKMERLSQFQDKIAVPSDVHEIWNIFLDQAGNLIKMDACALFLVDKSSHEFILRDVLPGDKGMMCENEIEFQIENGMFAWIIQRREPAIVPSVVFKNRKTIIMLPLSTVRRTLGIVLVLTPIEQSLVTQENLKLLGMLAKQCSLVMENTILYDDLRKEHESLKNAREQLLQSEKLASLGRLTAGASHEILNPLNSISVCLQLLLMDKSLNHRVSKYTNIMMDQSNRISKVVKGLLQFSQNTEPKIESLDMNALIEKAVSQVEHEIGFRHIDIIKTLDYRLPLIMGDKKRLSQVLFNLLSNAQDAMSEGGTLDISTRGPAKNIRSSKKPGFIKIRFKDTGHGISPENISRIFDPFFTTREAGMGTGLGLSLSYGIINDHGGTISVESKENHETVFTICLPVV